MGGCQSHWLSLRALSRRSRDPLGLAVPGQSFPLRTQANGGLETLEDLLGEIEVELARLAEQEAPPLVVDEELSAAAAAEAAKQEDVLRLERLLASASFCHDELRDNALALATLGWQLPYEPGGAMQPPPRQRRLPPPPPSAEEAAERAVERRRQRQLIAPKKRAGGAAGAAGAEAEAEGESEGDEEHEEHVAEIARLDAEEQAEHELAYVLLRRSMSGSGRRLTLTLTLALTLTLTRRSTSGGGKMRSSQRACCRRTTKGNVSRRCTSRYLTPNPNPSPTPKPKPKPTPNPKPNQVHEPLQSRSWMASQFGALRMEARAAELVHT